MPILAPSPAYLPMALPPPAPERPRHLKRDSSHLTNTTAALSLSTPPEQMIRSSPMSSVKRQRVAFSQDHDVRILGDQNMPDAMPQEVVQEQVRIALESRRKNIDASSEANRMYESLKRMFQAVKLDEEAMNSATVNAAAENKDADADADAEADKPDGTALKQYLVALTRRAVELKGCGNLVYAILDMNWLGRDEAFISVYSRFLGAVGCVLPGFLRQIVEKIVRHFVSLPSVYGRIPGEPVVRKRQMLATLHDTLRYLTTLIPSAANVLRDALQSQFPNHHFTSRKDYLSYMRNIFKISNYLPEVRGDVLALVTERLVKIDSEIQEELDEIEDDLEDDLGAEVADKDNYFLDDDTTDESDIESEADSDMIEAEDPRVKEVREKRAKLDAGMDFLFAHYAGDGGGAIVGDGSTAQLDSLLSLFTTFVVPTYRSRHVQFLAFHFAQLDAEKTIHFVSRCLAMIQGNSGPTSASSIRIGSAYLGSFVARGARVPRQLIREVVIVLVDRINALREQYEKTARGPDIGRYAPFYAAMQALLYIFCFRWRELLFNHAGMAGASSAPLINGDDNNYNNYDDDYDYQVAGEALATPGLRECLTQSIYSRLNPLKVCAPPIVKQYAAIANHIRYMFVYPLLETNKRVRLSSYRTYGGTTQNISAIARRDNALSFKGGEAHHQLDAFFPFDPYRLPRSKRWLEGDYNEWRSIAGLKYGDEEEDEEDEEEGGEGEEEEEDEDDGDEEEGDGESVEGDEED